MRRVNDFVREPGRNLAAQDTAGGKPSQQYMVCVWNRTTYYSAAIRENFPNTSAFFFLSQDGVHTTPSKLKATVMGDPIGSRTYRFI